MKTLSPVQQKFILHWGEMGTKWGINRTVAQLHALLFISPQPLNADELMTTLGVARSNVSNSLKELQGWGIVKRVHVLGDQRDHFESMKDVWEMFRVVLDERKKREIDPTVALLIACVAEAHKDRATDAYTEQKLRELQDFFTTTTAWYVQVRRWPTTAMIKFVKLGDKFTVETFYRSGNEFSGNGQHINDKRTRADNDHKDNAANAPARKLFGTDAFVIGKSPQKTDA